MTIAVVVIAAGRHEHLARLLQGLARQQRRPDDVVVVDMDPVHPVAPTVGAAARVVPLTDPHDGGLPLAAARNHGAAATAPADLVFLDVDCIPRPDLVAAYEHALARHPDVLACGPVRYLREGWLPAGPDDGAVDAAVLDCLSDAHPARPTVRRGTTRVADDHELFWSLSFATARRTWERLGGFDAAYAGYGGEDTDFAYRARARGIGMAWLGDGVAYHQWHPPARDDARRVPELVANARTFRRRWGEWPMRGWLARLHDDGRVHFDPDRDELWVVE